jgi:hypothetical protein
LLAAAFAESFESFGERRFEPRKGENVLGLAEGGSECANEDTEDAEVLLELGDPNRKRLCFSIEGSEILFKFGDPTGELEDLVREVRSQRDVTLAHLQPGLESKDSCNGGYEGADKHQDSQECFHAYL